MVILYCLRGICCVINDLLFDINYNMLNVTFNSFPLTFLNVCFIYLQMVNLNTLSYYLGRKLRITQLTIFKLSNMISI